MEELNSEYFDRQLWVKTDRQRTENGEKLIKIVGVQVLENPVQNFVII
jgi:hypothetical protein